MKDVKIAIFASGRGSNAVNIIKYFAQQKNIQFIILSNKQDALVLQEAERLNITSYTFNMFWTRWWRGSGGWVPGPSRRHLVAIPQPAGVGITDLGTVTNRSAEMGEGVWAVDAVWLECDDGQ